MADFSTEIILTAEECKAICRLGQGENCCAFLTVGVGGFSCSRMMPEISGTIFRRLESETMNAKGRGDLEKREGCPWGEVEK